ncbi:hypothetical protein ACNFIA_24405 [Pseudomonas sp. NY15437]|uniref:hypothetical protein n=1 Tax=Pseudomonas sp. NY15437 TaxID=3400360 RepID=UPI003A848C7B
MGADELDIDSDWKKARAFLLAYSTVVLLAWYFSADLNSISMMGVSIKIKDNAHNVWVIIAIINIYLLLRYIQKLPKQSIIPNETMRRVTENVLMERAIIFHKRKLIKEIMESEAQTEYDPKLAIQKVIRIQPCCQMLYREKHELMKDANFPPSINQLRHQYKHTISLSIPFTYQAKDQGVVTSSGYQTDLTPNAILVAYCEIYGFIKGALFTPWLSEYILPIIFAIASSTAAIYSWLIVNGVISGTH